jgi:molybdopterin molybdotransferase
LTGLLSVKEAQERILSVFQPVDTEMVPVARCAGRILAKDISAPGDLPPFTNSSMDGFAVRSADVQAASPSSPVVLQVVADIPAGSTSDIPLQPGQAARIMTGAALPPGADAVVPVENTDTQNSLGASPASQVGVLRGAKPGDSVRQRGMDVTQGQVLLEKQRKLQPQDLGILASTGMAQVPVFRRPRVALFSSGDELVQPGQPLGQGQIYDSNGFVLAALLEQAGAQPVPLGTAPDDPRQIEALLDRAIAEKADLILTSAGVSVGAFDYIRQVIEARGRLDFWKVDMRPGKPLAFGACADIPLIGLPGNPVSAFVGCLVFVLPAVRKLAGREAAPAFRQTAILGETIESDGRESYLRAVIEYRHGQRVATLTGHQGSGNMFSLVQAKALLIVPSGVKSLPSGSEAEIWFLSDE